jgi:hypothetical protein
MGNCVAVRTSTTVRRLAGHCSRGPIGVRLQSWVRIRSAISPLPVRACPGAPSVSLERGFMRKPSPPITTALVIRLHAQGGFAILLGFLDKEWHPFRVHDLCSSSVSSGLRPGLSNGSPSGCRNSHYLSQSNARYQRPVSWWRVGEPTMYAVFGSFSPAPWALPVCFHSHRQRSACTSMCKSTWPSVPEASRPYSYTYSYTQISGFPSSPAFLRANAWT